MVNLIRNEWIKIFKRPGTYVMISLLIVIISLVGIVIKAQDNSSATVTDQDWKQSLQIENEEVKTELETMKSATKEATDHLNRIIAINEYRITHNLNPNQEYSVWSFVNDASNVIQFAGLFVIIVAAGIIASEFSWGTIKLLLIRPISRAKILITKYITVFLFAAMMLSISFIYSYILGIILFGLPDIAVPYLNYYNGEITEQSMLFHLVILYGLKSINMIMLATMAFMISAVFRNSSLAIGLSIFLMFSGGQLTSMLAMKYDWAKYVLFANTELLQYFEGSPLVEGMTVTFSIIMLIIYFVLFQLIAHVVFYKRDVAA